MTNSNQSQYFNLLENVSELENTSIDFLETLAKNYPLHQPLQALIIRKIIQLGNAQYAPLQAKANLKVPFKEFIYEPNMNERKLPNLPPLPENAFLNTNDGLVIIEDGTELVEGEIVTQDSINTTIDSKEENLTETKENEELKEFDLVEAKSNINLLDEDELEASNIDERINFETEENLIVDHKQSNENIDIEPSKSLEEEEDKKPTEKEVFEENETTSIEAINETPTPIKDNDDFNETSKISESKPNNRLEQLAELSFVMRPKKDYNNNNPVVENDENTFEEIKKILKEENEQEITSFEIQAIVNKELASNQVDIIDNEEEATEIDENLKNEISQELSKMEEVSSIDVTNEINETIIDKDILSELNEELDSIKDKIKDKSHSKNEIQSNSEKAIERFKDLMNVVKDKQFKKNKSKENSFDEHKIKKVDARINESENFDNAQLSETMVRFLEQNSKFEEAIELLKTLKLKFPEKSAYFASEIKRIKEKEE